MKILEIPTIVKSIAEYEAVDHDHEDARRAAVAAIIREMPGRNGRRRETEALFILRATKEGDPWSGHMAFPGGHVEPVDEDLRATAERETLEEIGLDLRRDATYLGKLDDVKANPRGRKINMIVSPHVFLLQNKEPELNLNHEVADVLWGSLNEMYEGHTFTEQEFEILGDSQAFPGYAVGDQIVWGMTLRMLDHLFSILDPEWQPRG